MIDAAGTHTIVIDQGSTFSMALMVTDDDGIPYDLSGYTSKMQIRTAPADDGGTILATTCTTADGSIVKVDGWIIPTIPAATTAAMPPGAWVWDIDVTSPDASETSTLLRGSALIRAETTR